MHGPGVEPVIDGVPGLGDGLPDFAVIDIIGGDHGESDTVIYRNASRTITLYLRTGAGDGFGTACDIAARPERVAAGNRRETTLSINWGSADLWEEPRLRRIDDEHSTDNRESNPAHHVLAR
jgi:hypothetical protein